MVHGAWCIVRAMGAHSPLSRSRWREYSRPLPHQTPQCLPDLRTAPAQRQHYHRHAESLCREATEKRVHTLAAFMCACARAVAHTRQQFLASNKGALKGNKSAQSSDRKTSSCRILCDRTSMPICGRMSLNIVNVPPYNADDETMLSPTAARLMMALNVADVPLATARAPVQMQEREHKVVALSVVLQHCRERPFLLLGGRTRSSVHKIAHIQYNKRAISTTKLGLAWQNGVRLTHPSREPRSAMQTVFPARRLSGCLRVRRQAPGGNKVSSLLAIHTH